MKRYAVFSNKDNSILWICVAKTKKAAIKLFNHEHRSSYSDIKFMVFNSDEEFDNYLQVIRRLNPEPDPMEIDWLDVYIYDKPWWYHK